jgi:excisionase family DNA binding protein
MTVDQAAAHFGIGRTTVYRLIGSGEWPSSRLPGMRHRRFSPEDIARITELAAA